MSDETAAVEACAGSGANDDIVVPFRTVNSNVLGRIVRLGSSVNAIVTRHNYPHAVTEVVAEAIALVAMLGSTLKTNSAILTLQTRTDGPLSLLVADYQAPGSVRGFANYQGEGIGASETENQTPAPVFGRGNLALTIDPGKGLERYQGIVELIGTSLSEAAHTYFRQSEQLPTYLRLAVARHFVPGTDGDDGSWTWRAGGLMIQHLSRQGGIPVAADNNPKQEPPPVGEDDEDWQRARMLAATVEDHELLDPTLDAKRLLYRLFHEEGVKAFPPQPVRDQCRCSRDRVATILNTLEPDDLADMLEDDGNVSVTCEFCSAKYVFDPTKLV